MERTYTGLPPSVFGYVRTDIDPRMLQSMNNLIAVEMHQNQPDSANFVFDLALVGMIQPSFPELRIVRMGGHLALEWDPIYWHFVNVEEAASPDGPWYPMGESADDISIFFYSPRFFRLHWGPIP